MSGQKNPFASGLVRVAQRLAKAKPARASPLLFDAFLIAAAAGENDAAARVVHWMYGGRLPIPAQPATALSTSAIDGFCLAAGVGEVTRGLPVQAYGPSGEGSLEQRVRAAERTVRERLVRDAYGGGPPVTEDWASLTGAWRLNNRWRWIQQLARPATDGTPAPTEPRALAALEAYLDDWEPSARGVGYGAELVLAIDLALRHRRAELVPRWIATQGHRFGTERFLIEQALCLPAVAQEIVGGALRATVGLDASALAAALDTIEAAMTAAIAAAKAAPPRVPKIQRRRVTCEYSQFYVEPEALDEADDRMYFQDGRESAQGMSIFPSRVAIGTPTDTSHVDVAVSLANEAPELDGAVQAVAFPLRVDGPLCLRSVSSNEDEEPILLPGGGYDVLTCFYPKKRAARSSLRTFRVVMTFLPEGALDAPKCLRLEHGQPPAAIFVNPRLRLDRRS